ncbi:glycosyltransferase family protein [Butyrivibrio hungatei]|uniref:Glycosyl transferase GT4 family n=1 Tax=Butyrivibrio hungatei TaxID=185008 RepID=A0A1D9P3U9_9FIRM|nr:glycosyltransferase [Butyrivibrio hungatei]AOZ97162.1 glycosyl transferase GT4 family [Butyrivibrio hungatei]
MCEKSIISENTVQHIILFKGRYHELDFKIDRFIDYLKSIGVDFYIVDTRNSESYSCKEFDDYIRQQGCVMFTYNDIGISLSENGENVWKKNNIPVYTYLVDHPRYYFDELFEPKCELNVICCDRNHVGFCEIFYSKVSRVFFVPQGGEEVELQIPMDKRKNDVIYMGNCKEEISSFSVPSVIFGREKEFYSFCISQLLSDPRQTTEYVINEFFLSNNIHATEMELMDVYRTASHDIEHFVRRRFQLQAMHALDEEGVHVEIYGDGWEDSNMPFSDNIVIHERIPSEKLLNKVVESKISLCFVPWFKDGCSEKNFDSMINGALCVTDESDYLGERYKDGQNIIYFDLRNPEQMAGKVKSLLENEEELETIAYNGYQTAKDNDSWSNRYEYIYSIMNNKVV